MRSDPWLDSEVFFVLYNPAAAYPTVEDFCFSVSLPAFWLTGEFSLPLVLSQPSSPQYVSRGPAVQPQLLEGCSSVSSGGLKCIREIFFSFYALTAAYSWEGPIAPWAVASQLYSCCVFGGDLWEGVGWWCRLTYSVVQAPWNSYPYGQPYGHLTCLKIYLLSASSWLWWIPIFPATLLGMEAAVGLSSLGKGST